MTPRRHVVSGDTAAHARQVVLRRLAEAYDEFAEYEQLLVGDGYYEEAEVAHEMAFYALRAYNAESRPS